MDVRLESIVGTVYGSFQCEKESVACFIGKR